MPDEPKVEQPKSEWVNAHLDVRSSWPTTVATLTPLFTAKKLGYDVKVRLLLKGNVTSQKFQFYMGQGSLLYLISTGEITEVLSAGGKHAELVLVLPPEWTLYGVIDGGEVLMTARFTPAE